MAQPMPPKTRQSGPEAKAADAADALHKLKPGGPIDQPAQGYENPGPTDNLRGVEPNTAMHRGEPNPEQMGTDRRHGDHDPGKGQAGDPHGHGLPAVMPLHERHSDVGVKVSAPAPDPRGVRK